MKTLRISLFVLALFFSWIVAAQKGGHSERSKEYYVKYISQKLNLTDKEAVVFWPLMDAYKEKQHSAYEKQKKECKDLSNISASEAEVILKERMDYKKDEVKRYEALISDLRKILPIEKIVLIEVAERELRYSLMDRMKEQKGDSRKKENRD